MKGGIFMLVFGLIAGLTAASAADLVLTTAIVAVTTELVAKTFEKK